MNRKPIRKVVKGLVDVRTPDSRGGFALKKNISVARAASKPNIHDRIFINHPSRTVFPARRNYKSRINYSEPKHQSSSNNIGISNWPGKLNKKDENRQPKLMILGQKYDPSAVPFIYHSIFFERRIKSEFSKTQDFNYDVQPHIEANDTEEIRIIEKERFISRLLRNAAQAVSIAMHPFLRITDSIREIIFMIKFSRSRQRASSGDRMISLGKPNYFFALRRPAFSFVSFALVILIVFSGFNFVSRGFLLKDKLYGQGLMAYEDLAQAKSGIEEKNITKTIFELNEANDNFQQISREINEFGGIFVDIGRYIPVLSKLSTGKYLSEAGSDLARAGILIGQAAKNLEEVKNPLAKSNGEPASMLNIFQDTEKSLKEAQPFLEGAEKNLEKVKLTDIPEEQRSQLIAIKEKLPTINRYLDGFLDQSYILDDFLGGNGPRKYLFLFQNNQEMRATGGFIGSYGILDISQGRIRNFKVDGIFNPDGQLKEKIIPPTPLQKVSATWSLHDSNWFPDFPKSAEKAAWFFEKTGGPTVDGVITMTPEVLKKMIEITGPIDMPEYGKVITADNFIGEIQNEVEEDYDNQMNQPKKIVADLAPIIIDRIFNSKDQEEMAKTLQALVESLNQKHILIYSTNMAIEKAISEIGWSGEVLNSTRDYLSVINANINGYKTDGVIDENVGLTSEIMPDDGSIINTLTVTRHHLGGKSDYDWYNKVNADYMRVYVPKGSKLISAEGQTREFNAPPLDYQALGFKSDPQVAMEEQGLQLDDESGTKIYEDAGKTVFANWVYVSPQETVTVKYKYLLPFKIQPDKPDQVSDSYSLLLQKQSGSVGDDLNLSIIFPDNYKPIWKYPDMDQQVSDSGKKTIMKKDVLDVDRFIGVAFVTE
jgi:hypothetical protein